MHGSSPRIVEGGPVPTVETIELNRRFAGASMERGEPRKKRRGLEAEEKAKRNDEDDQDLLCSGFS